eukprot:5964023-Lingulodinium_polyedra.AAC.1
MPQEGRSGWQVPWPLRAPEADPPRLGAGRRGHLPTFVGSEEAWRPDLRVLHEVLAVRVRCRQ